MKIIQSIFLAFVFPMILVCGCATAPTSAPTTTATSTTSLIPPTYTPSPIPPTFTPEPTATTTLTPVEEALRQAEKWASIVVVVDLFGGGTETLPDVKLLNEGGGALLGNVDIDGAIDASQKVLDTPPSATGYNWFGTVMPFTGNSNQFVGVKSVPAAALSNLGIALKLKGDFDESETAFREAIKLQPDFFPAHNNLGWLLITKMEWEAATRSFREALQLEPNFAEAQANLGVALFLMGENEQAIRELEKARELFEMAEQVEHGDDIVAIEALLSELR
jgi:tetratricopeptide (TPR) repeat protein